MNTQNTEAEVDLNDDFMVEIEDDTPAEDRGREPMPKEIVEQLETDELDKYDGEVKERLKQLKKVWHDERRAKEAAYREQQEAVNYAKQLYEENRRIRETLAAGSQEYTTTMQQAATLELEKAKAAYRDAYESGDSERLTEAQLALNDAQLKVRNAQNMRPITLQNASNEVQIPQNQPQQVSQPVQVDQKALAWQERNPWFGQDEEMTASALGLHEKLRRSGTEVGSDEYYAALDKTIRKRFPEYFGEREATRKSGTVVAPATRSTSPNRVRLTASQVALARRLGLTPEQYAREMIALEKTNG